MLPCALTAETKPSGNIRLVIASAVKINEIIARRKRMDFSPAPF
jgi:hypothetical protein